MANQQNIASWFTRFETFIDVRVPNIIAETATEHFIDSFQRQSWAGQPWQPLSQKYAKRATRSSGRILTRTGGLQRSIRPAVVSPERVRISAGNAKVPYAKVHQEGFYGPQTVRRRSPLKGGKGGGGTYTRNQRIPKRQYMGSTPILRDMIVKRIKLISKAL